MSMRLPMDVAADAALLSDFIYRPSRRDPDPDTTDGFILRRPLRNCLPQKVTVFIRETKQRIRLKPGVTDYVNLPFHKDDEEVAVTVFVNVTGPLGITMRLSRLCRSVLATKHIGEEAFTIDFCKMLSGKDEVVIRQQHPLPHHLRCGWDDVHFANAKKLREIQWACVETATSQGTPGAEEGADPVDSCEVDPDKCETDGITYVVFCGRNNRSDDDIPSDLLRGDMAFADFNVSVHSSIWCTLTESGVLAKVEDVAADVWGRRGKLVLCGHDIGGSYAVLSGLHLLSKLSHVEGGDQLNLEIATFGAPQAIAIKRKDEEEAPELWHRLHAHTTQFVNGWDPLPRMPSSAPWIHWMRQRLEDVDDSKKNFTATFLRRYVDRVARYGAYPESYDSVGTIAFVSVDIDAVHFVDADTRTQGHREALDAVPPRWMNVSSLGDYHDRVQYRAILEQMRRKMREAQHTEEE